MDYHARITGTGSAFLKRRVTNDDIAKKIAQLGVETNDEWVQSRTGIRERRYSDLQNPDEHNSSLGFAASPYEL